MNPKHGELRVIRKRGESTQKLVRARYFLGLFMGWKVLGVEKIPDHVMISLGCFGAESGWKSQWCDVINAQRERDRQAAIDEEASRARRGLPPRSVHS